MNLQGKIRSILFQSINKTGINCDEEIAYTEINDGTDFEFNEKVYAINYFIKIKADSSKVKGYGGLTEPPYTVGETDYSLEELFVELYDARTEEEIEIDNEYLFNEITNYIK